MDELLNLIEELTPTELSKATQLLKLIKEKKNDFTKLNKERKEDAEKDIKYNLKVLQSLPYNIEEDYFQKHQFRKQDFYNTILRLNSLSNCLLELTNLLANSSDETTKKELPLLSKKINFAIEQIENTHHTINWVPLDPTEPNHFNSLIETTNVIQTLNWRALALYLVLIKQRLTHLFNQVTLDKITATQASISKYSLVIRRTETSYLKGTHFCSSVVVDEFGTTKDHDFKEDLISYLTTELIPSINNHISTLTFNWTDQWPTEDDEDEDEDDDD